MPEHCDEYKLGLPKLELLANELLEIWPIVNEAKVCMIGLFWYSKAG